MLLTERFHSIQGEGKYIGIPMYFIRTNRCNLRCKWCDSTYTFSGGEEVPLSDLISDIKSISEDWICFTGGEPMLQREAIEFMKECTSIGKNVLLETGGSLNLAKVVQIKGTYIDMDIKTPSSGEQESLNKENLTLLRENDYVKFVISDETDYNYALSFIKQWESKVEILLQPSWGTELKWLVEKVLEDKLNVRVLPQLHKIIWGTRRGV
ncbi:MAG: radical SAM protein [Thermoplasmataceae archaeon]